MTEDSVARFRKVQVIIKEKEECAIVAFWVSDRVDWCCVRFLPQHHVKHWMKLEEVLGQITEVYTGDSDSPTKHQKHYRNNGVAIAAIISGPWLGEYSWFPNEEDDDNNNEEDDENTEG